MRNATEQDGEKRCGKRCSAVFQNCLQTNGNFDYCLQCQDEYLTSAETVRLDIIAYFLASNATAITGCIDAISNRLSRDSTHRHTWLKIMFQLETNILLAEKGCE
jgi:hypothetical protein